jgi:Fe-S-cluster-containing dehydrogenase component
MPRHDHRWIGIKGRERGSGPVMDVVYMPVMCQHCDDAPCIAAAENDAVRKRPDGIVVIDPVKARGQRAIADACPYGAVRWNEELNLPQHWLFDAHLIDSGWTEPRCVQVCATGALKSLKVSDEKMAEIRQREGLQELQPESATKPRVHYKNLRRFTHDFIGGTVINTVNGVTDCVEGAAIRLEREGSIVGETVTDAYGEFKLDGLEPNSGLYRVSIELGGEAVRQLDVELTTSVNIGRIELAA